MTVIAPAVVEVWWARPASAHDALLAVLDDDERARRLAYRAAGDRDRFLVGAALARLVVAARLRVDPATLVVERRCPDCERPHGRPVVRGPVVGSSRPARVTHSVAHSGDCVVVAVTDRAQLGVDVELVRRDLDPPEVPGTGVAPWPAWVAAEAVLKATGEGLRRELGDLHVRPGLGVLASSGDRFAIVGLPAPRGHVAALAWRPAFADGDGPTAPRIRNQDGDALLRSAASARVG